jgi:antitoxin MazE
MQQVVGSPVAAGMVGVHLQCRYTPGEPVRVRVQKWGNSLAIRIPKSFAEEAGVSQGGEVVLAVSRGRLVVAPLGQRRYRLGALLAAVTPANLHDEADFGGRVGREAW